MHVKVLSPVKIRNRPYFGSDFDVIVSSNSAKILGRRAVLNSDVDFTLHHNIIGDLVVCLLVNPWLFK